MPRSGKKKVINWFFLGVIFLPILAVGQYFWFNNSISTLENYRSPLKNSFLPPSGKMGQPLTRKVVIVLFDGLRYDTSMDSSIMPFLAGLREIGASARMTSQPPSFSSPGWVTLLTGAWPEINDSQPMNPPDNISTRIITFDNIFSAADRADLSSAVSGYIWFEKMLEKSGVDEGFYTTGEDDEANIEVVDHSLDFLKKDHPLVLIHIDQIDFAGHHEGGPLDPAGKAAATRSDNLLSQIVNQLNLDEDTLILLSDHGQIAKGGHGGNERMTLLEPFIAVGNCISPGIYPDILMVDIAPTIAVLLGTNIPAANQGSPLLGMLKSPSLEPDQVTEALIVQQEALFSAYTQSIGISAGKSPGLDIVKQTQLAMQKARLARLGKERIWRNLLAVFFIFVPGYLLYLQKQKKTIWLFMAPMIYLVIFHFRHILLENNTYGFSWITGISDFILYLVTTTALALIPAWLIIMLFLHGFTADVKKTTSTSLAIIWMILYILIIPFLLNIAINGIQTTWTLPDFTIHFLGFFAGGQVLFISVLGIVILGVSAGTSEAIKYFSQRSVKDN